MSSYLDFVVYSCVSKGTTVLAEFNSGDGDLGTLALQCLEKYPPLHATFSHTIRNRIYSFLIEDPFVYFVILDEELGKLESFQFLDCVKDTFMMSLEARSIDESDNLTSHCLQEELRPLFSGLLARSCKVRASKSLQRMPHDDQNGVLDLVSSEKKDVSLALPPGLSGKQSRKKKKKKKRKSLEDMNYRTRDSPFENKVDVSDDANDLSREFSVEGPFKGVDTMNVNAKKMWRKHVCTVLLVDLIVCCVLFGVWLWVCRGFECIAS